PINTQGTGMGTGAGTPTTPDCNVNGTKVAGCAGTVTINTQTCTLAFMNNTVNVTCTNAPAQGNNGPPPTNPLNFNNIGASNDNDMATANFDGWGNSYSVQALQKAGITAGKNVVFNGVTFAWPNAGGGIANNVQAKGQVIPITPVQGATTLAFLGSAT